MRKTLRILSLCTLVLCSSAAHPAQNIDMTGSAFDLLRICESEDEIEIVSCLSFIGGVQASTQWSSDLNPNTPFAICLPRKVTWGQSVKMFIKFANENPNLLHSRAAAVMDVMYRTSFPIGPCSKE